MNYPRGHNSRCCEYLGMTPDPDQDNESTIIFKCKDSSYGGFIGFLQSRYDSSDYDVWNFDKNEINSSIKFYEKQTQLDRPWYIYYNTIWDIISNA